MDYQKIYKNLIERAKTKDRKKLKKDNSKYVYFENHHIKPKCLGGNNDKENLVLLTAKEHFVAHKLLTYIYLNNRKIALAFHKMAFSNKKYKPCSRDYEYARKLISITPVSKETAKKISIANKGNIPWNKGKHGLYKTSEETKQKIRNSHKGKKRSIEHTENWIKSHTGFKHSEETKGNWSKQRKGIKQSKEHIRKRTESINGEGNGMFGKNIYKIWIEKYGDEEANKKLEKFKEDISKINKGRKHTNISKQHMSIGQKNRKKKKCIYCNKEMDPGNLGRYHNEKCKYKK